MHPRNRYNTKPDFAELAKFRPTLKPYLIPTTPKRTLHHTEGDSPTPSDTLSPQRFSYTLDFSKPEVLCELTCAVLERDFNLTVNLPLNKLVPTVPQRLNYIHWVEDLLGLCEGGGGVGTSTCEGGGGVETSSREGVGVSREAPALSNVIGIDIGTGASCIYPLLGTRISGWRFLATDIDKESLRYARENVSRNGLEDKIKVLEVTPDVILEKALDPSIPQYSFCMCNPPFFKDSEERLGGVVSSSRSGRRPHASTFSSAGEGESITAGGEVEFVSRIIRDSLSLRNRVKWYTSMLGKKTSLKVLLTEIERYQIPVVTTTEFVQGKTWRWGIGWSFDSTLKEKVASLGQRGKKRKSSICLRVSLSGIATEGTSKEESLQLAKDWLVRQFKELKVEHSLISTGSDDTEAAVKFHCRAVKNTWSHQRKRKRIVEHLEREKIKIRTNQGVRHSPIDSESNIESHTHQESELNTLPQDNCLSDEELKVKNLEQKAKEELKALSTPCAIEFTCSLMWGMLEEGSPKKQNVDPKQKKKHKPSSTECDLKFGVSAELEYITGDNKDSLYQVIQYIQNKLP